jgi:hypothetical protein
MDYWRHLDGGSRKLLEETIRIMYQRITNNVPAMMAGAYMYTDDRNIVSEERMMKDMGVYEQKNSPQPVTVDRHSKPLLGTVKIFTNSYIGLVPEVILGSSFLLAKGIYPDPIRVKEITKEHFDIVKVEDMMPYLNKNGTEEIEHSGVEINYIDNC